MKNYSKTLQISLLTILAAIGVGIIAIFPLATKLTSECLYVNYSNDIYDSTSSFSSRIDSCLMKPTFLAASVTFIASIAILFAIRSLFYKEMTSKFIVTTGIIYAPMQLGSLMLLQSKYLFEMQQASTFPEVLRNYWFALDPVVYFLVAASIAWWLTHRKKNVS